ncbi:6-hydroxymethylpterin diphosphokinase MptE-like protein [Synechocystis sp. PCC 7338]|uniref:6-hydroxymethylpterin diphosphokinase MptE-like protein n=1 Tax=Synechocystis sp. PCC 7338 TaxID=2732530 RepID=UPI001BB0762E|nr:6-hydroxymethylpterin diphosphokinase MptE-like protein [Synechocystis sp. PCC 7338]QUS59973.1 DUF115 domain-containing protein [Synechocystis sp. PCC 7338]
MFFVKPVLRSARDAVRVYVNHYNDIEYLNWYFKYSKKLKQFKDIHKGEDCFIIGNGPSLNKMDLTPLRNYHTFGLNKIYLLFDKVDLNLSYHVAVNPLVIEQSISQFSTLQCPSFLSYIPSYKLFARSQSTYLIYTNGGHGFQYNIADSIFEGGTVTYVAIQIAFFMGFNRVFLIGVDHNFKYKGNPNELQLLEGEDSNHFSPNYFCDQKWNLPDLEGSELSYQFAEFVYTRSNRRIFDATKNGKLNIFQKIDYEQALNLASKKIIFER